MKGKRFKIVDDIPIPEGGSRRERYPFLTMEVGQCCVFEIQDDDEVGLNRIRSAASARNRRSDMHFVVRRIPDADNSVGVWRVE
jgi:hypothetical protein